MGGQLFGWEFTSFPAFGFLAQALFDNGWFSVARFRRTSMDFVADPRCSYPSLTHAFSGEMNSKHCAKVFMFTIGRQA